MEVRRNSPVRSLLAFGQSPWLDFLQRGMLMSGELERMILQWGIRGITSNPIIFEQAIEQNAEYDSDIVTLAQEGLGAEEIYEVLVVQDVQQAADLLLPVHEESHGLDGFACLQVSPRLAYDAEATIVEAKRLWTKLGRRNVMLKVPGTKEGLVAARKLLAEGININVTLLFSAQRYREVLDAWLAGLEEANREGRDLWQIASVASFFLSRIDTMVDAELAKAGADEQARGEAQALRGKAAIASARLAYSVFRENARSLRWQRLAERGAPPQRLLWASTGRKDPAYSELKYVEALIGPLTVNTMPLETLRAYDNHGNPRPRLEGHPQEATAILQRLAQLGIDIDALDVRLLHESIKKFAPPFDASIEAIEAARRRALAKPDHSTAREAGRGAA